MKNRKKDSIVKSLGPRLRVPTTAANILATIGGVSILGNIAFGFVSDRIGNRQTLVVGFALMTAALFWLLSASEVWKLLFFASVFGFAVGGSATVLSPLVADLFGLKSHGLIYGICAMSFTSGGAFGPIVAGHIFDISGSYQIAFIVCAIAATIGLILAICIRITSGHSV